MRQFRATGACGSPSLSGGGGGHHGGHGWHGGGGGWWGPRQNWGWGGGWGWPGYPIAIQVADPAATQQAQQALQLSQQAIVAAEEASVPFWQKIPWYGWLAIAGAAYMVLKPKRAVANRRRRRNPGMVGRRVAASYGAGPGVIVKWEPYGAGMTDVLVEHDDGKRMWHASSGLRAADGLGPLPSRREAEEARRLESIGQLEAIRAQHVRDFDKPWPGAEHGKALVGMGIDAALADLKGQPQPKRRRRR